MDHAASVFGRPGYALRISFVPELTVRPIAFPQSGLQPAFVVANTLVTSVKRLTAPVRYVSLLDRDIQTPETLALIERHAWNLRVVETSIASDILAKRYGLFPLTKNSGTLRGFQDAFFKQAASVGVSTVSSLPSQAGDEPDDSVARSSAEISTILTLSRDTFTQQGGYTLQQLAEQLELSEEAVVAKYMTKYPVRAQIFQLYKRVVHVLNEAMRVIAFQLLLSSHTTVTEDFLKRLGAEMNDSQSSCRDLFECSCPEIEQMCALARAAGSYGSRLTGAGWGGCTIHLTTMDKVQDLVKALKISYYYSRGLSDEDIDTALLVTGPGSGAAIFTPGTL